MSECNWESSDGGKLLKLFLSTGLVAEGGYWKRVGEEDGSGCDGMSKLVWVGGLLSVFGRLGL